MDHLFFLPICLKIINFYLIMERTLGRNAQPESVRCLKVLAVDRNSFLQPELLDGEHEF
jgi:hypothetical protein